MSLDLTEIKKKSKSGHQEGRTSDKKNGEVQNVFAFLNKDISFGKKGLKDQKKEQFYSELNILLTSGTDVRTAMDIVVAEQTRKKERVIFEDLMNRVLEGVSLSEAMEKSGEFTPYEYYSVRIGEESGKINNVLKDLSIYFSKKIKQKKQFTSALTYPTLVLVTAIGAVIFMMNFVVPMFVDVFKRFKGDLPALTKAVVKLSNVFSEYLGLVLLIIVSIILVLYFVRKKNWYRNFSSKLLLKIPMIGDLVQKIYLARFCQSMALLIGSKTPMLRAIQLIKNMITFYPYQQALTTIEKDILYGKPLYESMAQFSIFDKRTVSLTKVAEEINQLDTVFSKLNDQYSDELEHRIGMLSSVLEPIMIIFVGLLVGIILIAMYMPMFQLGTSMY
ncbi:MAG TPA: type II secretion system F family protein [Bacteroidales bacterium]|nr:type II secretion system F family protein [Bacteroidales bacterium]